MREARDIIRGLLHTEKGTGIQPDNKYLFQVDKLANKMEIKKAVETIYKVKVQDVNTLIVPGKKKRVRYIQGRTPDWKKAIVTLKKDSKIDVT